MKNKKNKAEWFKKADDVKMTSLIVFFGSCILLAILFIIFIFVELSNIYFNPIIGVIEFSITITGTSFFTYLSSIIAKKIMKEY